MDFGATGAAEIAPGNKLRPVWAQQRSGSPQWTIHLAVRSLGTIAPWRGEQGQRVELDAQRRCIISFWTGSKRQHPCMVERAWHASHLRAWPFSTAKKKCFARGVLLIYVKSAGRQGGTAEQCRLRFSRTLRHGMSYLGTMYVNGGTYAWTNVISPTTEARKMLCQTTALKISASRPI